MASPAPSSSLSRYPKWVLAATGFAAAYGTYLIWSNWPATDPSANLQRRNTVRVRNNPRSATRFHSSPPSRSDHPFGVLHIDHNGNVFRYSVGQEPPAVRDIRDALHISHSRAGEIASEAQEVALKCIIQVLLRPDYDDGIDQSDVATDLQPLLIPLRTRDIQGLMSNVHILSSGDWKYDIVAIAKVFSEHCGLDRVPLDPDRMDLGMTETTVDSDQEDDREPAQGIKGLLYNIAEEQAKRQAYVHRGIRCESCGELPIRGVRWHCNNCADFDLCSACEAQNVHPRTHVFTKIRIPISTLAQPHEVQDLWYPGDPQRRWPLLKVPLRKRLATETGFEDVQIEAFYDQFSCIANVSLPEDPLEINAAIDRRAFNKAMMSPKWQRPLEPNFLFDRMFNFYDTDNNGIIDFKEFVSGLAYLRMPARRDSFQRVFRGYDADGDGYVSRRDFVRMLSAKYAVQKYIVRDVIEAEELDLVRHTSDIVRSSQPISAAFAQEDIPPGAIRTPNMKSVDQFGELQVRVNGPFGQAVLPNGEEPPDSNFISAVTARYGINPWPEEVVEDGKVTMEHAMHVRNRFTISENVRIGDAGSHEASKFLVETDSRDTRGRADLEPAEERWKQDIKDAAQGEAPGTVISSAEADTSQSLELPEHILERGRAYQVPSPEQDFGKEVIFQVVQEGINELIDPLFEAKERLATSVRETRAERRRFRKEIDDHVKEKKAFQEELEAGADVDPLMATANAANTGGQNENDTERQRNTRSATVSPNGLDSQNQRIEVTLRGDATDARPSQRDIAQEIREQIAQQNELLPMDDAGFEDMETSIREQPLEELLASAGFSVASPVEERHESSLANEAEDQASDEFPSNIELGEEFTPSEDGDNNDGDDNGDETDEDDQDDQDDNDDEDEEDDDSIPPLGPLDSQDRPDPISAPSNASDDDPTQLSDSSPPSPPALPMQTPFSTPSMISSSSVPPLPPPHRTPLTERSPSLPSKRRLEELSLLDEEEKRILIRGGPARLDLAEFEEIVRRDQEEGQGMLVGLVEGWLEWAAF